jgi:uncharacterized damage-inducible protein DinB
VYNYDKLFAPPQYFNFFLLQNINFMPLFLETLLDFSITIFFNNKILKMKTTIMKNAFAFIFLLAIALSPAVAQNKTPASPPATATGKIGEATISINYGSPSVKGRQIWGALIPYGKVWRAGANKATVFETDKDLTIEGKTLVAGKYSLFAIPNETEWSIIFNSETGQWGTKKGGEANRDPAKDVLTVAAKSQKSSAMNEKLQYDVTANGFVLKWDNLEVPVSVQSSNKSSVIAAASPVKLSEIETMTKEWERAKAYTMEYLEAMPETGYSLKPTPEMRSFAEQMLHFTEANFGFGAAVFGSKSPYNFGDLEKSTDKTKATVTKTVMAGYDFIIDGLKKATMAQLGENVQMFGKFDMTKGTAIHKAFEHQTHHRGQTTVYIRLAGAKPPQEKLF